MALNPAVVKTFRNALTKLKRNPLSTVGEAAIRSTVAGPVSIAAGMFNPAVHFNNAKFTKSMSDKLGLTPDAAADVLRHVRTDELGALGLTAASGTAAALYKAIRSRNSNAGQDVPDDMVNTGKKTR